MQNIYFILRHGNPAWKYLDIIYPADEMVSVGLSRQGREQIKTIAKDLKKQRIDLILSSDYRRTKETAQIIAKSLDLKVSYDKRLQDQKRGVYCGRPIADFYQDFPDPKKRFGIKPQGGESWNDVRRRVVDFLRDTEKKYKNKKILIISHGDPLWLLEGAVKGLDNEQLLEQKLNNTGIEVGELRKLCP